MVIAASPSGEIFVAAFNGNCLQVFSTEGKLLHTINGPGGVVYLESGKVVVSEYSGKRLVLLE
jgi:hypothetical protein